jgi:methionyl-tRNA formyltransferase
MEKVVFFGNERLATGVTTTAPTLQALIAAGYEVLAVVSHHEAATSRKQRELEIAKVAEEHHIPLLLPEKPGDIAAELKAFDAEIGVLVAYGKIVPQSVIEIFPKGIINIHPSALPKHRGPTPVESVILGGNGKTAVSVMKLVKAMDAGPVYAQRVLKLEGDETKQELAETLLEAGGELLLQVLPSVLSGEADAHQQHEAEATYDLLIKKEDGRIDWTKPAVQLEREVRAYAGWPKSTAVIGGMDIVVTKARVHGEAGTPAAYKRLEKELMVFCGQDALVLERVQPAGKAEMDIASFLNGYGKLLV